MVEESAGRRERRQRGAEVALIINNPLLRRGCSAFVLSGLVPFAANPVLFPETERARHTAVPNLRSPRCTGAPMVPDDDSLAEQNTNWFASPNRDRTARNRRDFSGSSSS